MDHRFIITSLASYLLFILPLLASQIEQIDFYISFILLASSAASAVISGLLTASTYSFASPLIGGLAAFITNYLLEIFSALSSSLYFSWLYLSLTFIASPTIAFAIGRTRKKPLPMVEEVPGTEEAGAAEMVEEKIELIICPSCGQRIPSGSIYCPLCGAKVAEER